MHIFASSTPYQLAEQLGQLLQTRQYQLAIAESCTGGALCSAITDVPGSSGWFDRGFITYSNSAKCELLEVSEFTLHHFGAVSRETALEMVSGVLKRSQANLGLAVTGIAGPDGGSIEKPIGTVFVAWQLRSCNPESTKLILTGNRLSIRQQAVEFSLRQLIQCTRAPKPLSVENKMG